MPQAQKGQRFGGRQKGTPNKATATVKEALTQAFDERGGVPALLRWANENETEFYRLWGRLIPTEIKADVNGKLTLESLVTASMGAK